jgi:hypothetical protein
MNLLCVDRRADERRSRWEVKTKRQIVGYFVPTVGTLTRYRSAELTISFASLLLCIRSRVTRFARTSFELRPFSSMCGLSALPDAALFGSAERKERWQMHHPAHSARANRPRW